AMAAVTRSVDGIAAVSWVALTKVVVRVAPFHCTVLPATKPVPVAVSVKAAPPTAALDGARLVSAGAGLPFLTVSAADALEAVPVAVMSAAGIAAVSCVALTKVVVRAAPFHCTVLPATKPLPVAVSVKAAPPTVALDGARLVRTGAGLPLLTVTATAALVAT